MIFFPSNIKSDEGKKTKTIAPSPNTHYLSYSFVTKEQREFYFGGHKNEVESFK